MKKLKKPMETSEIKELLRVNKLPEYLNDKITYSSSNLRDFYIGFNRIAIGDPVETSYKAIVKNLVIISKELLPPVIRNENIVKEWKYDVLPDEIIIILNVKEEFFTIQNLEQVSYNLIGIFSKEDFIEQIETPKEFDEFTSFIDDEEEE